jgi:hypothetical protein
MQDNSRNNGTIKTPHNEKGQAHGLWENYYNNVTIFHGMYVHNNELGYWIEGKIEKKYYAK